MPVAALFQRVQRDEDWLDLLVNNAFELLEVYPSLTSTFDEGIAASASWDGSRPIRSVDADL